jgi:putative FmdB family regulatory protein
MPTYEYECTKCSHTFEIQQSIFAEPLKQCPKCKGRIRRLIGGGMGVIFKGSGFYTTDNKKSSTLTGGNGGSSGKDGSSKSSTDKPPEKPRETTAEKSSKS